MKIGYDTYILITKLTITKDFYSNLKFLLNTIHDLLYFVHN